jgi:diaminopimelate epimerase
LLFTKVQGLGNDFVLVNCFEEKLDLAQAPEIAARVCDRYFGVGADGLILLLPADDGDVTMRIFNSDGSEAEMCGNGIRCAAKYLYERGLVKKDKIKVKTLAGMIIPELIIENGIVKLVRVDMGEPRLERSEIPMEGPSGQVINEPLQVDGVAYQVSAVSMGNPHCIIFVPDTDRVSLREIGPRIEKHPVFPRKTNVEFVQVLNRQEARMKVWERGAGETMACGTGACATAVACVLNGHTGRRVTVHLKGGALLIEWEDNNHVYMTGPAEEVFTGDYPD